MVPCCRICAIVQVSGVRLLSVQIILLGREFMPLVVFLLDVGSARSLHK